MKLNFTISFKDGSKKVVQGTPELRVISEVTEDNAVELVSKALTQINDGWLKINTYDLLNQKDVIFMAKMDTVNYVEVKEAI